MNEPIRVIQNRRSTRAFADKPIDYVFPITLLCLGYPKATPAEIKLTPRFPQENIHFRNTYQRFDHPTLAKMFEGREPQRYVGDAANIGQHYYARKFSTDFSIEMTRSVKQAIQIWIRGDQ